MPHRQQPWFTSALHFCGSCCITVACWAVWLVLGATLCCLIYIAVAKELPVPDFVLRRVEAELAKADLGITFGRAVFDPTGRIMFQDVRLRSRQFEDPLVTSRLVFLRRSFWSVLAGRPVPDEIRLEGAALQLPAMLSPSGTIEPLLRDATLILRHDESLWQVDQFAGRIGRVAVTAAGQLRVPPRPRGAAPLSPSEIAARFLQVSRRLALEVHRFDAFEEPSLSVRLDNPDGVGNTATLLFTARSADQPWAQPLTLGPLAVTTTLRLEGRELRPVRLHAAVESASYRGEVAVLGVRAILSAQVLPEGFSARPMEALLVASRVDAEGETALGPVLRAGLDRWPNVEVSLATQIRGEFLAAQVDARLKEQSAHIRAEGRGAPGLINAALAQHTPRAAPYFVFGDPVAFNAGVDLAPGWHFARLSGRVDAGRLDSHGVMITAARGRIDIAGMDFLAHDARVELRDNFATGSYWMNFKTTDYRMLLEGRLRPLEIEGWFKTDWWRRFWSRSFAFPAAPPEADVEVSGRWKEPLRTLYYGRADTGAAQVLGADFTSAHTLIFLRPQFTDAIEIDGVRADGRQHLNGTFRRYGDPLTHETRRVEFNISSNVDRETYGRMSGGKVAELLDSFRFTQPPQVHAQGVIEGHWPGAVPDYTFTGVAAGGLEYFGFPLDSAEVAGGVRGTTVRIDDLKFTAAGGKGGGKATLDGAAGARRLGFDLFFNGADLARTIRGFEQYQAKRTGQKPGTMAESKFMKRASGGRLDVALSAEGVPGDIATFKGSGNAALTGTELGEIHLFGLLSQVLSGLSLNFSSLKLNAAHTSFKLEDGRLNFPDLKITGSSAVIDAHGYYTFANSGLDFTAKLKPFEENRNPLTFAIGIVINPITSILELKLNGPLSKPNWSIVVGPSAAPPAAPAAKPPVPAVPPADPVAPKG